MSAHSPTTDPRPASDVSTGVGLSGLAGLLLWIAVCRNWPQISEMLSFPGPRWVLSGPYAALTAVLFSTTPMVLYSLLIDKVHLRPSTGIDWKNARPVGDILDISITKLAGLWATWGLIAAVYCIARYYWRGQYLFSMEVLGTLATPLFVLSIPYVVWLDRVLVNPRDGAWHFGAFLIGRERFDLAEIKHHWRAWIVKGFFCAFMISILPFGFRGIVTLDLAAIAGNPAQLATWLTELLFVIDVQIAMVGYLVTMKPLDAQIRTANPYLGGWVAALICYPPFILMGDGGPLNYHPNTGDWAMWLGDWPVLMWYLGCAAGITDGDLCLGHRRLRTALFQSHLSRRADQRTLCLHPAPGLCFEEPVLVVRDDAVHRNQRLAGRFRAQHRVARPRQPGLLLASQNRREASACRGPQIRRLQRLDAEERGHHARIIDARGLPVLATARLFGTGEPGSGPIAECPTRAGCQQWRLRRPPRARPEHSRKICAIGLWPRSMAA